MSYEKTVGILIATYNGSLFVSEQIESICRQTFQNWRLYISDDGSSDDTVSKLQAFANRDPRIQVLQFGSRFGAKTNFSLLSEYALRNTRHDVFFYSDQDDIWHSRKIEIQLDAFCPQTKQSSILCHHDLVVVDQSNKTISSSLFRYMCLDTDPSEVGRLLRRNFVTGCSMACNRKLLQNALPMPESAIMHDWWLAIVAATTGKINVSNEPLIRYRQHDKNTIGAKSFWQLIPKLKNIKTQWQSGNQELLLTFKQAQALHKRLSPNQNRFLTDIEQYCRLKDWSRFERCKRAFRLKVYPRTPVLFCVFFLRLFLYKR